MLDFLLSAVMWFFIFAGIANAALGKEWRAMSCLIGMFSIIIVRSVVL